MVYGRTIGDRTLDLEPSGALKSATLVMRDRQTDSWWSIMTSSAIGGPLEGTKLEELPVGEKTTWARWRAEHPKTLVLSVAGRQHVESDPYENYFRSDETFRGTRFDDDRLPAKTPIFAFWLEGAPYAVSHAEIAAGRVLASPIADTTLVFYRAPDASIYESSLAWLVRQPFEPRIDAAQLLADLESGRLVGVRISGFDTFWYTWAGVNRATHLLAVREKCTKDAEN